MLLRNVYSLTIDNVHNIKILRTGKNRNKTYSAETKQIIFRNDNSCRTKYKRKTNEHLFIHDILILRINIKTHKTNSYS